MPHSTKPAGEPFVPDPVYALRDDIAAHFKPINAFERMLVGNAADALQRYHDARQLERRLYEKTDPLELLTNQPETFKMITRHVADCERAWRKALEEIRRAIRRRETTLASPNARRSCDRPPAPEPLAAAAHGPNPGAPAPSRRE